MIAESYLRADGTYDVLQMVLDEEHAPQREAEERRQAVLDAHLSSSLDPSKHSPDVQKGLILAPPGTSLAMIRMTREALWEQAWRHSGSVAQRRKTYEALYRCEASAARLQRFIDCGSQCWVKLSPARKEVCITSNNCRDRWCPACGRDRGTTMAASIAAQISEHKSKFVTLTRKHSHAPLTDQIDGIYDCFRRLRGRKWWSDRVHGGAAFLELHRGDKDGLWHVHLHILVESDYLPQGDLSKEWYKVTNDSTIVHIKAVPDLGSVARYVSKYVTKPASHAVYNDPASFDEMVVALKGRRLCATFGAWRGWTIEEDHPPKVGWIEVCRLSHLWAEFRTGNPEAVAAWGLVAKRWPHLTERWTGKPPSE